MMRVYARMCVHVLGDTHFFFIFNLLVKGVDQGVTSELYFRKISRASKGTKCTPGRCLDGVVHGGAEASSPVKLHPWTLLSSSSGPEVYKMCLLLVYFFFLLCYLLPFIE